jgi:hypothetical protein
MKAPKSELSNLVPHVGELPNQYEDELQLLHKLKPIMFNSLKINN